MSNLTPNYNVDPDVTTIVRDLNRGFKHWNMRDIYMGTVTKGKFVPNVGDIVDDIESGIITFKEVIEVDEVTLIPTFRELNLNDKNRNKNENQFHGVGPGYQSETWRIFFDPNVNPHTLMVDVNLHVYGEEAAYIKIFKGRDITQTGRVISQYRPHNNAPYSENVPLYQIGNRHDDSTVIKRPMVCHTTEHLELGEEVTAVAYTASGIQSSKNTLIVNHNSNIRALQETTAYVSGIELISPFISASDDRLVEFPSNLSRENLFTMGRVHYSDGTSRAVAIDGSKFSIIGLDHYISTIPHETNSFGLTYHLGENELAWGSNTGLNRHITEIYRYRTLEVDGSYSVMLHVVPEWNGRNNGWSLRYYISNLERSFLKDVTAHVEIGTESDIFNGRRYGIMQQLTVAVELSSLELGLDNYRHVQTFEIGLKGDPTEVDVPYLIHYFTDQEDSYGEHALLKMKETTSAKVINLDGHVYSSSLNDFLQKTYDRSKPLFNGQLASRAPIPTHFVIVHPSGETEERPISDYNKDIPLKLLRNQAVVEGNTLVIYWVNKLEDNTKQWLAATGHVLRY